MTSEKTNHSEQQAKAQLESVRAMVAALECDYERLEELRDERAALADALKEAEEEAAEPCEPHTTAEGVEVTQFHCDLAKGTAEGMARDAREALIAWDEENAEELAELEKASTIDGDQMDAEKARERIQEDALSVEVRSGWTNLGEPLSAEEFCITLCTGGPAVRIRGELSEGEPHRAWLEHQDWGTTWQEYYESGAQDALLAYARVFYFGE